MREVSKKYLLKNYTNKVDISGKRYKNRLKRVFKRNKIVLNFKQGNKDFYIKGEDIASLSSIADFAKHHHFDPVDFKKMLDNLARNLEQNPIETKKNQFTSFQLDHDYRYKTGIRDKKDGNVNLSDRRIKYSYITKQQLNKHLFYGTNAKVNSAIKKAIDRSIKNSYLLGSHSVHKCYKAVEQYNRNLAKYLPEDKAKKLLDVYYMNPNFSYKKGLYTFSKANLSKLIKKGVIKPGAILYTNSNPYKDPTFYSTNLDISPHWFIYKGIKNAKMYFADNTGKNLTYDQILTRTKWATNGNVYIAAVFDPLAKLRNKP